MRLANCPSDDPNNGSPLLRILWDAFAAQWLIASNEYLKKTQINKNAEPPIERVVTIMKCVTRYQFVGDFENFLILIVK